MISMNPENLELLENAKMFGKIMPSVEYMWLNAAPRELKNLSNVYGQQFYVYANDFKIVGHGKNQKDADELVRTRHPDLKNYEKFMCNLRFAPPIFVLMDSGEIVQKPKTEVEYKKEGKELEEYMHQKLSKALAFSRAIDKSQKTFIESKGLEPYERLGRVTSTISKELMEEPELSQQFKADVTGILIEDCRSELGI